LAVVLDIAQALGRGGGTARAAVFALGIAGIAAIPVGRNVIATGAPSLYESNAWELIWMGTQWNEVGRATGGIDVIFPPGYASWTADERITYTRESALASIRSDPGGYASLTIRKLLWLWLPAYPEWSLPHKVGAGSYFAALYALGVAGLVRNTRSPFALTLAALVLGVSVTTMLTIVDYDARYRMPGELCLIPLAASALMLAGARLAAVRGATASG
jgi:hypothetical protein